MKNIPYYERRPVNNIKEIIYSSFELFGDKAAFLVKNKKREYEPILYKEVKENIEALGTALIARGLKNKRIAIVAENRYEWALIYLATVCGVGVIVPLDKELPEAELASCLNRAKASAVVYSGKCIEKINTIKDKVDAVEHYISMEKEDKDSVWELIANADNEETAKNEYINSTIDNEEMAVLLFTSGTTSTSKAVMLSHKNIAFNTENQNKMINIQKEDVFLGLLPFHHILPQVCGMVTPLYDGASIAFCEGLKYIQKNLQESKTSILIAVPLILESMYKKIWAGIEKKGKTKLVKIMINITNALGGFGFKLKRKLFAEIHNEFGGNIKLFITGGAAINPETLKGLRDFGFIGIQGYGLTECAPIVAVNRDIDFKDNSIGLPMPGTEVKVDVPNEEGIGEIITKAPYIMIGYYEDEEATREVIKDGWFYTGDLGFIDKDGFVHMTGRKKNIIITKNGKNVYPEEIEYLLEEIPYVKEAMVYGKEEKNDIVISAQLFLDQEYLEKKYGNDIPGKEELKSIVWEEVKKVNNNLVIYKHVINISIRDKEFEKTTTLKIKRYKETV